MSYSLLFVLFILGTGIVSCITAFVIHEVLELKFRELKEKKAIQDQDNLLKINRELQKVRSQVIGTANQVKGGVSELAAYLQLKGKYDYIYALGGIIDFLCIAFPKKNSPGEIMFVEVKDNKHAKTSKSQQAFAKLVKNKSMKFTLMKLGTTVIGDKLKED